MGKPGGLASLSPGSEARQALWDLSDTVLALISKREMNAQKTFQTLFTSLKSGERQRKGGNTRTTKLGVYIDNSNIQGQGAEGQQSRHHGPGQQGCPAAQREEMDEGPVGKNHNEKRKENTHPHLNPASNPIQLTP